MERVDAMRSIIQIKGFHESVFGCSGIQLLNTQITLGRGNRLNWVCDIE